MATVTKAADRQIFESNSNVCLPQNAMSGRKNRKEELVSLVTGTARLLCPVASGEYGLATGTGP